MRGAGERKPKASQVRSRSLLLADSTRALLRPYLATPGSLMYYIHAGARCRQLDPCLCQECPNRLARTASRLPATAAHVPTLPRRIY